MRETIVSNCEKKYLLNCLENNTRLDGRAFNECRELKINFGRDWGCCHVSLGSTSVIAQVTCEVQQPNTNRPGEGLLNINIELNPLAAPHFEAGRQSEQSVQLNRLLEKCIKDSKAVDLESLCIKSKESVWAFRVDINVLNHEGNIQDCASIAALTALAHFRRPDVTFDGEEFTIHTYEQRDPIPTVIHHYPVCVSYAIFNKGDLIIADPTFLEEGVAEGHIFFGLNNYKELCGLHLGGSSVLTPDLILQSANKASKRANTVIQYIKKVLENDKIERKENKEIGFHINLKSSENTLSDQETFISHLDKWTPVGNIGKGCNAIKTKASEAIEGTEEINGAIKSLDDNSGVLIMNDAEIGKGTDNTWQISSNEESDEDMVIVEVPAKTVDAIEILSSDGRSEEDEVIVIEGDNSKGAKKRKKRKNKY